jgi:hypothetical protein
MTDTKLYKSERALQAKRWTVAKAKEAAYVTERDDGFYVGDRRIVMDAADRADVLEKFWQSIPPSTGYLRAYSLLVQKYLGISRAQLQQFISARPDRQKYRRVQKPAAAVATAPKRPLAVWSMDFCKLPAHRDYNYCLVLVDDFSGLVYLTDAKGESAQACIRGVAGLLMWLNEQQPDAAAKVRAVRTDNGPGFVSQEFKEFLEEAGIRHRLSRAYHALGNARAERMVQTVRGALHSMAVERFGGPKQWQRAIATVMDVINRGYSRIRGGSPMTAAFDQARAATIRDTLQREADSRRSTQVYGNRELQPGQKVRLSLRLVGTPAQRARFKDGSRKGSEEGWDVENVYVIKKKWGPARYKLEDYPGLVDRTDMLAIPS